VALRLELTGLLEAAAGDQAATAAVVSALRGWAAGRWVPEGLAVARPGSRPYVPGEWRAGLAPAGRDMWRLSESRKSGGCMATVIRCDCGRVAAFKAGRPFCTSCGLDWRPVVQKAAAPEPFRPENPYARRAARPDALAELLATTSDPGLREGARAALLAKGAGR